MGQASLTWRGDLHRCHLKGVSLDAYSKESITAVRPEGEHAADFIYDLTPGKQVDTKLEIIIG